MYSSSRLMSASISPAGRCQFSWLKANRVSTSTPASQAPLDHLAHRASSRRGGPAAAAASGPAAQRPLPSMMIATWAGTAPCTRTRCSRSSLIRQTSMISASLAWMRPSICLMWSSVSFWTSFSARVLSSLGDVLELLDPGDRVGARVAHGDPALLGELVDHLHQLLAPLLRERRAAAPGSGCPASRG